MTATDLSIYFFGDSICVGQHVSIHRGWVTRISARLDELGARLGRRIAVTNASANGRITREALLRMPYEVQSHRPDVVIVQFGMNDCTYWKTDCGLPRVSPEAFSANLREIVDRAYTFGARTVMLNTNHPTTRTIEPMAGTDLTYEASNLRYNELIRDVAAGDPERIRLNDVEAEFRRRLDGGEGPLDRFVLDDGLHLSAAGHDVYFDLIGPRLESLVAGLVEA